MATVTYTATGKRATMTDASGTTTYTYDSQDRLITKATPQGTPTYTPAQEATELLKQAAKSKKP